MARAAHSTELAATAPCTSHSVRYQFPLLAGLAVQGCLPNPTPPWPAASPMQRTLQARRARETQQQLVWSPRLQTTRKRP